MNIMVHAIVVVVVGVGAIGGDGPWAEVMVKSIAF